MTDHNTMSQTPEAMADKAEDAAQTPKSGKIGPLATGRLTGNDVQANLSAMGTVQAGTLSATGSMIGAASIDGDAAITASFAPAVMTKGETTIQQSYTSAIIVGGGANTKIHQAFAPIIVGKTMDASQSGACLMVTGEAEVKHSWVGIVLAPKAEISEDSHVIITTGAALIIGAALFGGLGLVALAVTLGVRRVMHWRPSISMPNLPDFSALHDKAASLQKKWQGIVREVA